MVTLSIPAAVAVLLLLAYMAHAIHADTDHGRHELAADPAAYRPRPWDEVTDNVIEMGWHREETIVPVSAPPALVGTIAGDIADDLAYDPLDHRIPLAVVEQVMASFAISDARVLEPA